MRQLHDRYEQVPTMAVNNGGPTASHSIEEAVIVLADDPAACDAGGAGPRGGATGESRRF